MSAIYYVKNNASKISYSVQIGTTATASTVSYTSRTGTGTDNETDSEPKDNGNIPQTSLGNASNLIGSSLVVNTDVRPIPGQKLDDIFNKLSVRITLKGGIDGEQTYERANGVTVKSDNSNRVFFVISIKFQTN